MNNETYNKIIDLVEIYRKRGYGDEEKLSTSRIISSGP